MVSLAGDWFTLIALYGLLAQHTGRAESIGLMLAMRFLPPALLSPVAGVLADRLPRKWIMVACDLLRAGVVLGFLAVRSADDVWLVYALTFLQMGLAAFFDPAEQAAIASTVEPHEQVTAHTLLGATWSAMLSFGALAGGALTALVGREASFVVDALSYLVSAVFVAQARLAVRGAAPRPGPAGWRVGLHELREGLALVAARADVQRALTVKVLWAVPGGAVLLLYAVMGERVFPVAGSPEAGIGVLLGMRGVGALLGPLLARRLGGDAPACLERAIGVGFAITAVCWAAFALAPTLPVAALCLLLAHTGISTQWVFSTSLLALRVEDRLRGRVFALDFMAYLVVLGLSSWLGGLALDELGMSPRHLVLAMAGLLAAVGVAWWALGRLVFTGPAR